VEEAVKLEAWFVMEKETKNTVRYQEEVESHPLIRYIYIQKTAVELLKVPVRIKITIEKA